MTHIKQLLPKSARRWLVRYTRRPRVGRVDFGDLRRTSPISRDWGGDRGQPIDRYYIEQWLAQRSIDIRGRVLEVGDNIYTQRFGDGRVSESEIVHAAPGNPKATYVADFVDAPQLPSAAFDCLICTQTLQLVTDLGAAIATLHRILKPGGVLLVTVPGISQLYRDKDDRWLDYSRFTTHSVRQLFTQQFSADQLQIESRGNVLAAIAFLHGLASEELTQAELDMVDENYQVSILIRASK